MEKNLTLTANNVIKTDYVIKPIICTNFALINVSVSAFESRFYRLMIYNKPVL